MQPHKRPRRVAENHQGDVATGKVLLVAQVLVRRQEYVKTSFFRRRQQIPVRQAILSALFGCRNDVPFQMTNKAIRSAFVKEDAHPSYWPHRPAPAAEQRCGQQNPAPPEFARGSHGSSR
jgi:hypothetical protein